MRGFMIQIICKETLYVYNLYHLTKAFFPHDEIETRVDTEQEPQALLKIEGGSCFCIAEPELTGMAESQQRKQYLTGRWYDYLVTLTGKKLAWGMLTGVRPTKLAMQAIEQGKTSEEITEMLLGEYRISQEKATLGVDIAKREREILSTLDLVDGFSLYIGIPFCPTICSYCSFGSAAIEQWCGRTDQYLTALCKEIEAIGRMTRGKKLNTIYIGGGTPTTLEVHQLEQLLQLIDRTFTQESLREYTIEAGRPDTITPEKLAVIRSFPVTRISINPQSMQQQTLDAIGRLHTVTEVKEAFYLARECGFDNINMDLIAGLPGEGIEKMQDTLQQIEALNPDSLTVHALAIKRAAKYGQNKEAMNIEPEIEEMLKVSKQAAVRLNMKPYYLYRQKNIAGNFENVGYAKAGKAGIYNIIIMEEKQTILAAGAGAMTKIVLPDKIKLKNDKETSLIRVENAKDIETYIDRIDEMIERKGEKWLCR